MADRAEHFRHYNVVASFRDAGRAQAAVDMLVEAGVPSADVSSGDGTASGEQEAGFRAQMQDELDTSFAAPGFFLTDRQTRGAAVGTLLATAIGGLVGLAAGLVWGFAVDSEVSFVLRLTAPIIAFGIAGATAGFIAGGGVGPRQSSQRDSTRPLDDQRLEGEDGVLVTVRCDSPEEAQRATNILEDLSPERVDFIHESGRPVPPQHRHPRPADPPDRWWGGSGRG